MALHFSIPDLSLHEPTRPSGAENHSLRIKYCAGTPAKFPQHHWGPRDGLAMRQVCAGHYGFRLHSQETRSASRLEVRTSPSESSFLEKCDVFASPRPSNFFLSKSGTRGVSGKLHGSNCSWCCLLAAKELEDGGLWNCKSRLLGVLPAGLRSLQMTAADVQVLACTIAVAKTQIGTFATKGLLLRRMECHSTSMLFSSGCRPYYLSPELCQEKLWPHPTQVGIWTCVLVCFALPGNTTFLQTFGQWDAFLYESGPCSAAC